MPIYKFRCDNEECDHITEFLHLAKVRDDGSVGTDPCPESAQCAICAGTTKKVFEAPGLSRITFDRNGKKGIEIRHGNSKRLTSATREKYEHDIGNKNSKDLKGFRTESVHSKSVQKVLDQRRIAQEKKK
jgi:predicted nucleic acid-binding Zn ribbon protein